MRVTLRDIAQACQVDVSTVSRALRCDERVKLETREQIQETAASLGYRPNLAARSLVAGRTFTVWMILPSLDNALERKPAEFASLYLAEHGYDLLIALHHGHRETYVRQLHRMEQHVADGAIIIPNHYDYGFDEETRLLESKYPLVFLDRHAENVPAPVVTSDNRAGGETLAMKCAESGGRRFLLYFPGENPVQRERLAGARRRLEALGLPYVVCPAHPDSLPLELPSLDNLVADDNKPLAIIANGSGDMRKVIELLTRIERHAQLGACFDDWPGSTFPLREVHVCVQDFQSMAQASCRMLLAVIEGETELRSDVTRVPPLEYKHYRLEG